MNAYLQKPSIRILSNNKFFFPYHKNRDNNDVNHWNFINNKK
jgi:hypothetical protein